MNPSDTFLFLIKQHTIMSRISNADQRIMVKRVIGTVLRLNERHNISVKNINIKSLVYAWGGVSNYGKQELLEEAVYEFMHARHIRKAHGLCNLGSEESLRPVYKKLGI